MSDRNHWISRAYRVLDEGSGAAYRATLIINPTGIIESKMIYPKEIGRNAQELLRMVKGIQYNESTGKGVPANWVPGLNGIEPNPSDIGKY